MNKCNKENLENKIEKLRRKVIRLKKFTKKKDWKDFRAKVNKENTDEQ